MALLAADPMSELAHAQDGVATLAQLSLVGVTASRARAQVAAGRWARYPPLALVLHNGPLTRRQCCWVALLNAGPAAALCAFTALELDGLEGWGRPVIEVIVRKSTEVRPTPGVRVHESRRFDPLRDLHPGRMPPRTRTARSAVDAASWSRSPRTAVGVLAAVVQQRLVRPDLIAAELAMAGRIRHHRLLARALADIGGGAEALSEIDFARLCRRFHLPEPRRQEVRVEPSGQRRYLDAEWVKADGRHVVAEVDGAVHLLPRNYWDDMQRGNELVLDGRTVLRFAAYAVRTEPEQVADQLRRALRP